VVKAVQDIPAQAKAIITEEVERVG